MNDNNFDKRIKELVDSCHEPLGNDLWGGIEKGMLRKRRITIFKRAGYAVAAAACVAMGLILFVPEDNIETIKVAEVSIDIPAPQIAAPQMAALPRIKAERRNEIAPQEPIAVVESTPAKMEAAHSKNETPARKEASDNKTATIQEQLPQTDYSAYFDEPEPKKKNHRVMIGVTSNIIAANPGSSDFSAPQYAPGMGSVSNYGIVPINEPNFYFPLSFGLQLQVPIVKRFSVGVGVNYTLLHSQYQALIDNTSQGVVDQNLHYIGVPLSLYFNIVQTDQLKFYADCGGMIEKGLQSKCSIKDLSDNVSYRTEKITGVQWSANVGLGFEYRFVKFLGLYLDPSITYFFDSNQPFSVRTSQPLQFKMELGLRFHL